MKRKCTILLLIFLLTMAGCRRTTGEVPAGEVPAATPGSSIRSGSAGGFEWSVRGSTLVVTGEGVLDDLFSEEWNALVYEVTSLKLDTRITAIGDHVFSSLFNLSGELTLHEGITAVGDNAFSGCGLILSPLPASLTHIGAFAFTNCILPETFTIPASVQSIGDSAFAHNVRMKVLKIEGTPTIGSSAFAESCSLEEAYLPELLPELSFGLFAECPSLTTVYFPEGITVIPGNCFSSCTGLTELILPDTVTVIEPFAFFGCSGLSEMVLPDGLQEIGENAFMKCTSLTGITIPASVRSIGELPFLMCTSLTKIQVDADNPLYASDDQGALYTKDMSRLLQPPPGVDQTFQVPESVPHIYTWTFRGCQFDRIILPDSLQIIDYQAFADCPNLQTLILPDSVTSLSGEILINCPALQTIRLPASAEKIYGSTFKNCTSLTELHLPGSITRIEASAFRGCTSLSDIYFEGSEEQWNAITICPNNEPLEQATIHFNVPYI